AKKTRADNIRGVIFRRLEIPEQEMIEKKDIVEHQITISEMVAAGELSSTTAKQVSLESLKSNRDPRALAKEMDLIQLSNESEIEKIVAEVIAENPKVVQAINSGQKKAIGYLVGQVMAKSRGQANPSLAQKLIIKQIGH